MALNAAKVSGKPSNYVPMEPGTNPARLVGVVDLGLQAQRPYQGKDKPPAREVSFTYEFTDVFMKDEDGQDQEDKPRWLSEQVPFHNLSQEKAKSTIRYKVLDPTEKFGGDWTQLIGTPVLVTVVLNPAKDNSGKVYENIGATSPMRQKDTEKLPPLKNEPLVFDLDNPSLETWKRIPKFLQDKIRGNLEYTGSALDKLLGPQAEPPKQATKPDLKVVKPVPDEEEPPY